MEEFFQNSKKEQPRGVYFNFRKFLFGIQQSENSSRKSGPLWTSHSINHCTLKSKMASILLEVMVAFKDISAILPTFQFDHSVGTSDDDSAPSQFCQFTVEPVLPGHLRDHPP